MLGWYTRSRRVKCARPVCERTVIAAGRSAACADIDWVSPGGLLRLIPMSRSGWSLAIAACVVLMAIPLTVSAQAIHSGASVSSSDGGQAKSLKLPKQRVGCDTIISKVDRDRTSKHRRVADMSEVARQLGTSIFWVEHCMLVYGRHPKRPGIESAEAHEELLESLEEDEPEETASEDIPEPGAVERKVYPLKERRLHLRPPPTPRWFGPE